MRLDGNLQGFLVHSRAFTLAGGLQPIGVGNTDSAYDQAGPSPGTPSTVNPYAKAAPRVSNGQAIDFDLVCSQAGLPVVGEGNGGQWVWRPREDSLDNNYRGWDVPFNAHDFHSVDFVASGVGWDVHDMAVLPSSSTPIVAFCSSSGSAPRFAAFDFSDRSWTATTIDADLSDVDKITLFVLPDSERIIVICDDGTYGSRIYYSDDLGTTWAPYSITGPTSTGTWRTVVFRGDVAMFISPSGGDPRQYISTDLGASFDALDAAYSGFGTHLTPMVLAGEQGICVAYLDSSGNPACRTIGAAGQRLTDVDEIEIDGSTVLTELTGYADDDGAVYVYGRKNTDASVWVGWRSYDGGSTWVTLLQQVETGDDATYMTGASMVAARGQGFLCHNHVTSPGTTDNSLDCLTLGGWTSMEIATVWAGNGFGTIVGQTYWPWELPDSTTWSLSGTGAASLVAGALDIDTTSAVTTYGQDPCFNDAHRCTVEMCVTQLAGGSTSALQSGYLVVLADGVFRYRIHIRLTTTGFAFRDQNGGVQTNVSVDMTQPLVIRMGASASSGKARCSYRRPWETKWTHVGEITIVDSGGGGGTPNDTFRFGNFGSNTGQCKWHWVHWSSGDGHARTAWRSGIANAVDGDYGNLQGKALNAHPYPAPELGPSTQCAYLRNVGGPAGIGEAYTCDLYYQHGVQHLDPTISPSPAAKWRSATLGEQIFAFEVGGGAVPLGRTWTAGLALLGTNIKTALLERWDGASWNTVATWNGESGTAAMPFARSGEILTPGAGAAAQYFDLNVAKGCTVDLGGGDLRRLDWNKSGVWDDGSTSQAALHFEGHDGTEAASGTLALRWPSAVHVEPLAASQVGTHWRVRVPAQTTAEGYLEIGALVVGSFHAIGWRWDHRALGKKQAGNVTAADDGAGVVRRTRRGNRIETWTLQFQQVDLTTLQGTPGEVSYYGHESHEPLIAKHDVVGEMLGVLEATEDGVLPVLVVDAVDDGSSGATIVDPRRFCYGLLSPEWGHVQLEGAEGASEVLQLSPMAVDGLP